MAVAGSTGAGYPFIAARITFAACRPCCLAAGASPSQSGACPPVRGGRIADCENPRAAAHPKIVIDEDTAGFVPGLAEPFRCC